MYADLMAGLASLTMKLKRLLSLSMHALLVAVADSVTNTARRPEWSECAPEPWLLWLLQADGNAQVRNPDCKKSTGPDQHPIRRWGGRKRERKAGFPIRFHYHVDAHNFLLLQVVDCIMDGGNQQEHSIADVLCPEE